MPTLTMDDNAIAVDTDALRMVGNLFLLARTLDQRLRLGADDDQLTVAEVTVLGQADKGNDLPSAIARAMRIDPGRVTRLTDRLVALGYLIRESDASDRRRCVLRLTRSGETRLARVRTDLSAAMTCLLAGLSETDRTSLMHGLEGARRLIDAQSEG